MENTERYSKSFDMVLRTGIQDSVTWQYDPTTADWGTVLVDDCFHLYYDSYRGHLDSLDAAVWFQLDDLYKVRFFSHEEWFAERLRESLLGMQQCIQIDPEICRGLPVLRGTRITIARILADMADGYSALEVGDDLELDSATICGFLDVLALYMDRPI